MIKINNKILCFIFTFGLCLNLLGCQKDTLENVPFESESQQQTNEIAQTIVDEIVSTTPTNIEENPQTEEVLSESTTQAENNDKLLQNEFFDVYYDSVQETDDFYSFTFVFTNISDISYYKGDELYQPGESWEKVAHIPKHKLRDYCKNPNYIHYKLLNASVYDPDAQKLFAGGVRFDLNEELEVYNLEMFEDVPIEMN